MLELFCCMLCNQVFQRITTVAHWIASARKTMSHTLFSQHYSGLVFWNMFSPQQSSVQSFQSCAGTKTVKLILDGIISIIPHPFVPMHPSHSHFWSGTSRLDWCEELFTTNLKSRVLFRFLVKFDEFYSGRWFPIVNIAYYFIGWNHAKSTGIHGGAHPRSKRVTAFAHLICISL